MIPGTLLALIILSGPGVTQTPPGSDPLVAHAFDTEGFLQSADAKKEPRTVGRFFSRADYARLRGNPILGYWSVGGFRWTGGPRIAWLGIEAKDSKCRSLLPAAWDAAVKHVLGAQAVRADAGAPVKLRGACITAEVASSPQALAGVLLEVIFESPTGLLHYRWAVGKKSVEEAMVGALEFFVAFARQVDGAKGQASATSR